MSADRFLLLNCGTTHLTGAVFHRKGGALALEDVFSEDLPAEAGEGPAWEAALADAWSRLRAGRKLPASATLIVPGGLTLAKILKVPHVEAGRLDQAVAYEVSQNLPHALAEVAWDYHVIGDDGVETEVIALAIRETAAEGLCRAFTAKGLQIAAVAAGPVLDVNAWRFCDPAASEPVLLVHVGARSTNLVFLAPDSFVLRNLPLGGNALTQALADTIGLSYGAAEEFKVGVLNGSRSLPEGDPALQHLQAQAQAFLRRLGTELTRSVIAYRRQHPEAAPARVLLAGRGALLPGLAEFVGDKLAVPVEFFDPTAALELPPHLAAGRDGFFHQMSELVGLAAALAGALPDPVQIDLLPTARRARRRLAARLPWLLGAAAALTLAAWVPGLRWTLAAAEARTAAAELRRELGPLAALEAELAAVQARTAAIVERIRRTEGLVDSRANWINLFADLQDRLVAVEDVWLEELEVLRTPVAPAAPELPPEEAWLADAQPAPPPRPPQRLRLVGRMLDYHNPLARVSGDLQRRVNRRLDSFTGSEFIVGIEGQRFDTSENGILRFEFTLVVNPERPL